MNIFKNLEVEYRVAKDNNLLRIINREINNMFGLGISAKTLKEYFGVSGYDPIFDEGNMEKFFKDMLTEDESTKLLKYIQEKNAEYNSLNEVQEPKQEEPKQEVQEVKQEVSETQIGFNLNLPLGEIVKDAIRQLAPKFNKDNQEEIKRAITEVAKQMAPNIININNVEVGEVKGKTHKDFKHSMDILVSQKKLFLKGEAGTGKTYLAEQLAQALNLDFDSLSLTAGISEGYIIGRTNIQGDFISTRFIELYENGGVFLLDEVDAADANTLLILNKAISSRSMPVPLRIDNPIAKRHEDFYIVCAANTWGNGAEMDYTGREMLDEAFLNRFSVAKIEIDWDEDLEKEILKDDKELCNVLHELRRKVKQARIKRLITTRTMIDAYKYKQTGKTTAEVVHQIMIGWTNEEIEKVC